MKIRRLVAAALAAAAFAAQPAQAKTELTLSNWLPPSHPIVKDMVMPWAAEVEKATKGEVTVKILASPLGKPPAHFDIAREGQADVTFGVHGYQPGRFQLTKAAEFPFLGDSSEAMSVAYWRVHARMLAAHDEHKGVQVLGVFVHGPGGIYNAKHPVTTLADLSGLKVRVGGGVVNDVAQALGAVPLLKPSTQSYELLSNGVADGIFFPPESIPFFKLTSVLKYGTLIPGGLYNTSFFLVMNQAKFDSLPEAQRKAVMSVSGERFARIAGKAWDTADAEGMKAMKAAGIEIITASQPLMTEIHTKTAGVEASWVAQMTGKGIDGAAIMAALRAEIAKAQAGK